MNRERLFGSKRRVKVGSGQLLSDQSPSWTQQRFLTATECSQPKFFQNFRSQCPLDPWSTDAQERSMARSPACHQRCTLEQKLWWELIRIPIGYWLYLDSSHPDSLPSLPLNSVWFRMGVHSLRFARKLCIFFFANQNWCNSFELVWII